MGINVGINISAIFVTFDCTGNQEFSQCTVSEKMGINNVVNNVVNMGVTWL